MARGTEGGSTLLLFPAAVLVVLVLAAIAADSATVFLGERELANATAAAANDVASEAFANQAFYERGRVELAPGAALDLATAEVGDALGGAARYRNLAVEATVAGNRITVRAAAEVPRLFGGALPGTPRWVAVDARTTVRAVEQPGGICASDGGGC